MTSHLAARRQQLYETAHKVWADYQRLGPGKLSPEAAVPVLGAAEAMREALSSEEQASEKLADRRQLARWTDDLCDLVHRCCHHPQGLCFITGEAGLIPRQDLHARFDAALHGIRGAVT